MDAQGHQKSRWNKTWSEGLDLTVCMLLCPSVYFLMTSVRAWCIPEVDKIRERDLLSLPLHTRVPSQPVSKSEYRKRVIEIRATESAQNAGKPTYHQVQPFFSLGKPQTPRLRVFMD